MPLLDSPPEVVQRFHALGMSVTRVEAVALGPIDDTAPLDPRMGSFLRMCVDGLAGCLERKDAPGLISRDAACVERLLCRGLPYMGVAYGAGAQAVELADAAVRLLRAVASMEKRDAAELAAFDLEGRLAKLDSNGERKQAWGDFLAFYRGGTDYCGALASLAKSAIGERRVVSSGHLAFREWKRSEWADKQAERYCVGVEEVEKSPVHKELRRDRERRSWDVMRLELEIDKRWGGRRAELETLQKVREGLTDRELGRIRFQDDGTTMESKWRRIQHEAKANRTQ